MHFRFLMIVIYYLFYENDQRSVVCDDDASHSSTDASQRCDAAVLFNTEPTFIHEYWMHGTTMPYETSETQKDTRNHTNTCMKEVEGAKSKIGP